MTEDERHQPNIIAARELWQCDNYNRIIGPGHSTLCSAAAPFRL